jgi:hypothetical protein
MSLDAHLATLADKHVQLEKDIEKEVQRPHPDSLRLMTLKRQKLKLKEQLMRATEH